MTDAERECRIEAAADEERWRREAEVERLELSYPCFFGVCGACEYGWCDCACHGEGYSDPYDDRS